MKTAKNIIKTAINRLSDEYYKAQEKRSTTTEPTQLAVAIERQRIAEMALRDFQELSELLGLEIIE